MKKISTALFVLLAGFVLVLTSCNANKLNKKAEDAANAFYLNLQQKEYDKALALCSEQAFSGYTKEEWLEKLKRNAGLLGSIKSYTRTNDFNIEVSTSTGTTVVVVYDVAWQYGQSKDSLLMLKDKEGNMRVTRYSWQHANTGYMKGMEESEKQARLYMDALQQGNYPAALDLCGKEAFEVTPKAQWMAFLENSANRWGVLNGYEVKTDSTAYVIAGTGRAGKGNYYDVIIQSNRNNRPTKEKVVFFQKDYNDPLRLTGHSFL